MTINHDFCLNCDKFEVYDKLGPKNHDNCWSYLCNCNKCPHDKELEMLYNDPVDIIDLWRTK